MRLIEVYWCIVYRYFRDENYVEINSGLKAAHFKTKELNGADESITICFNNSFPFIINILIRQKECKVLRGAL